MEDVEDVEDVVAHGDVAHHSSVTRGPQGPQGLVRADADGSKW